MISDVLVESGRAYLTLPWGELSIDGRYGVTPKAIDARTASSLCGVVYSPREDGFPASLEIYPFATRLGATSEEVHYFPTLSQDMAQLDSDEERGDKRKGAAPFSIPLSVLLEDGSVSVRKRKAFLLRMRDVAEEVRIGESFPFAWCGEIAELLEDPHVLADLRKRLKDVHVKETARILFGVNLCLSSEMRTLWPTLPGEEIGPSVWLDWWEARMRTYMEYDELMPSLASGKLIRPSKNLKIQFYRGEPMGVYFSSVNDRNFARVGEDSSTTAPLSLEEQGLRNGMLRLLMNTRGLSFLDSDLDEVVALWPMRPLSGVSGLGALVELGARSAETLELLLGAKLQNYDALASEEEKTDPAETPNDGGAMRKLLTSRLSLLKETSWVRAVFGSNRSRIYCRDISLSDGERLAENLLAWFDDLQLPGTRQTCPSLTEMLCHVYPRIGKDKKSHVPAGIKDMMRKAVYEGRSLPESGGFQRKVLSLYAGSIAAMGDRSSLGDFVFSRGRERSHHAEQRKQEALLRFIFLWMRRKLRTEGGEKGMMEEDRLRNRPCFVLGQSLALLQAVQAKACYNSGEELPNVTIEQRLYVKASTRPLEGFVQIGKELIRQLSRLSQRDFFLRDSVAFTLGTLADLEPALPKIATMEDEGAFCLGYWQGLRSIREEILRLSREKKLRAEKKDDSAEEDRDETKKA